MKKKTFITIICVLIVILVLASCVIGAKLAIPLIREKADAYLNGLWDSVRNQYEKTLRKERNVYHGQFDWPEMIESWDDSGRITYGTMQGLLEKTLLLEADTERMTVYSKEEIENYLDSLSVLDDQPFGNKRRDLSVLHENFPVELIFPYTNHPLFGQERIRIVYKVQDESGNMSYMNVLFCDEMGTSPYESIEDGKLIEYGKDENGNTIYHRLNEEYEAWRYSFHYISSDMDE